MLLWLLLGAGTVLLLLLAHCWAAVLLLLLLVHLLRLLHVVGCLDRVLCASVCGRLLIAVVCVCALQLAHGCGCGLGIQPLLWWRWW